MLASNCSSYMLVTFQPKEIYLLASGISLLTGLFCAGFYKVLEALHHSQKEVYFQNQGEGVVSAHVSPMKGEFGVRGRERGEGQVGVEDFENCKLGFGSKTLNDKFPDRERGDTGKGQFIKDKCQFQQEEQQGLLSLSRNVHCHIRKSRQNPSTTIHRFQSPVKRPAPRKLKNAPDSPFIHPVNKSHDGSRLFSISKMLGETQIMDEFPDYITKVKSDFRDIFKILTRKDLKVLMLVVTLENLTPEISCIFFYYFIEILKFSYFDVNSVFVFASVGFLCSLVVLNLEFIGAGFENFYKVTSFLLAIAYYLNLR